MFMTLTSLTMFSVTEAAGLMVEWPCTQLGCGTRCVGTPCKVDICSESVTNMRFEVQLGCISQEILPESHFPKHTHSD